jgi:cell division protein FtsB
MKRVVKSRTYQAPETKSSYKFWKDLSFFGCIMSGILLGLMILALLAPESGIPKVREVIRIKRQLEMEIDHLDAENERLRGEIEAMKTDPFWQEKVAREELNLAKPGEIIYKFAE